MGDKDIGNEASFHLPDASDTFSLIRRLDMIATIYRRFIPADDLPKVDAEIERWRSAGRPLAGTTEAKEFQGR